MRIAFLTWEYPPNVVGGLGVYSQYAVRELLALGQDVVVFTPNHGDQPEDAVENGARVLRPRV